MLITKTITHDLERIGGMFQIEGMFLDANPYGTGHINDTYLATYQRGEKQVRYIHQRINHEVFLNPVEVMENIQQVTAHIGRKLSLNGTPDLSRRVLRLVPAVNGTFYAFDSEGSLWRTYFFVEGTKTYEIVEDAKQAFEVARVFGEFQLLLVDLPQEDIHETIPYFHHTRRRFDALVQAIEEDPVNRANEVQADIRFALEREGIVDCLLDLNERGIIPERITHNDTKVNNLLIDKRTEQGICVTDLDTIMPGLALYDFGDMVRTATNRAAEDEKDLRKVEMDVAIFKGLVQGYLDSAGGFLNQTEREHLVFSGKLITFEIGIRFLTDYLQGDVYFKTSRTEHNLDRCRTQFKLVNSIEENEEPAQRFVEGLA